jgi:hypothetical protein
MTRVEVRPELLRWACARAGYAPRDLADRFPQLPALERGEQRLIFTFKQLEALRQVHAHAVRVLFPSGSAGRALADP